MSEQPNSRTAQLTYRVDPTHTNRPPRNPGWFKVLVQTPWGELLVFSDADATAAPAAGAPVGVGFDAGDAIVLAR